MFAFEAHLTLTSNSISKKFVVIMNEKFLNNFSRTFSSSSSAVFITLTFLTPPSYRRCDCHLRVLLKCILSVLVVVVFMECVYNDLTSWLVFLVLSYSMKKSIKWNSSYRQVSVCVLRVVEENMKTKKHLKGLWDAPQVKKMHLPRLSVCMSAS